tara:strand:+ start:3406 stop:3708 length:303 start_codon:yes stop_codon:yes gene_type:complete
VTSSELTEWFAYYQLDPWDGSRRHDLPAAIVASTVANVNRGKNSRPLQPTDFMPDFDGRHSQQTAEDIFGQFRLAETLTKASDEAPSEARVKVVTPGEEK